jgi:hypothetical protein
MFAVGAVTWNSKKQLTIVLLSMEAEYMALSIEEQTIVVSKNKKHWRLQGTGLG